MLGLWLTGFFCVKFTLFETVPTVDGFLAGLPGPCPEGFADELALLGGGKVNGLVPTFPVTFGSGRVGFFCCPVVDGL